MQADIQQRERLWTKNFLFLTLSNLLLFIVVQIQAATMPAYVKEAYVSSDMMASLVVTMFNLCAIVSRIYAGEAIKTTSSRTLIVAGLIISGLAVVGYHFSASIALLIILRGLFGIGFGLGSTAFATSVSNAVPQKRLGEGMGYFGLSVSLALALGPIIGINLLQQFGFGTMVLTTLCLLAAVFPLLLGIRRQSNPAPSVQTTVKATGFARFYDKKIVLPTTLNFLLSITYGGLISFLVLFGQEANFPNVSWFFLCFAATVVLVRPLSGKLFDRKGHQAVVPLGVLMTGIGLFVLSFADQAFLLYISAVFYGFGFGFLQPSLQAWTVQAVALEQRGMANAAFLNSIDLGIGVGSLLLGIVATYSSYAVMYRWSALFMVVFLLVYAIADLRRRRLAKALSEQQVA
ncbi:MFS transporter [Brevibacillus sp. TJ4]|uniref:MFS transporter n=1 Tax=Brevibacillus sp. TJ4 TaxID=3234853 RepID=UPI003B9E921C